MKISPIIKRNLCYILWLIWYKLEKLKRGLYEYINFLVSLTLETERIFKDGGTVSLPKDLNIITWNYDMQMELAFARYLKKDKRETNFKEIVTKNVISYPLIEAFETDEEKLPNLVHLNGVAGLYEYKNNKQKLRLIDFIEVEQFNEAKAMHHILEDQIKLMYFKDERHEFQSHFDNSLTYSWEKIKYGKIAIGRARAIMESTDILVIIGYSFPFFNREADRYILEPFLERTSKTRKIYFQDPNPEAYHNFCGKFNIEEADPDSKLSVTPITNVEEFHLPFEM